MPSLLQFDPNLFLGFVLIFARMSGLMVAAPIFGEATVPPQVRAGLALLISLVFYPIVAAPKLGADPQLFQIVHLVIVETGVGLLIGFSARLLLSGIELAGEVAGFQMGLGLVNVIDPTFQNQVSLVAQTMTLFATLILVVMDGHHLFIQALASSYTLVPAGTAVLSQNTFQSFTMLTGQLFVIGLKVGAPLVVSLLAANFAMGLMARSVPQMNVFVVGFPFTIGLGLVFLVLGFPYFVQSVADIFHDLDKILMGQLQGLH
jgi:flagellar biosynthetic protein FliR